MAVRLLFQSTVSAMTAFSAASFRLDGRLALVTGSSQGIGLAIARGFCEVGGHVVINGRDAAKVAAAAKSLRADGHTAHEAVFDVSQPDAVEAGINRIEREIGPLAILVNNAGTQIRSPLEDMTDENWRTLMGLNLDAVFYVAKRTAKHMITRKRGSIINICSVMSELARPTVAPYTASKGGVKMLTKAMATDWGQHGIRVNGIGPGYFKTELNAALVADQAFSGWLTGRTPLNRWGDLDELKGAAVFLASDAASFVSGHVLYVDGGVTARL
jgi:gluconate 5-dehydrogenase